ncbi:unnamed protein product [Sphagnum balticum]
MIDFLAVIDSLDPSEAVTSLIRDADTWWRGRVVAGLVVLVRDVEKRFGGDASDVKAGSSECSSFLDADGIESEL